MFVGTWRDGLTRMPVRLALANGALTLNGERMTPVGEKVFTYNDVNNRVEFTADKSGSFTVGRETDENGSVFPFFLESEWKPSRAELASLAGEWYSEEAQAAFTIAVEGDKAFLNQRPSLRIPLQPLYIGHFVAQDYVLWVTRDARGKIDRLHIGASRMRDMPFVRAK